MANESDRRTMILRKAARVFLKHGYDATSMNLIAENAGVTKPGLYYHFKGKQELLFSIMSYAMEGLEKATLEATLSSTDNVDRLRRILNAHARILTDETDGAFTLLVIDETQALRDEDRRIITHRKRAYFELIRGTLEQLRREGLLRDVDVTVGSFSLLGMVMWISKWYRESGRLDGDTVADQITSIALASVVRDVGAAG